MENIVKWSYKDNVRWYETCRAIKHNYQDRGTAVITEPVTDDNWCGLTPEGREIINSIIQMNGVTKIWAGSFDLSIEVHPHYNVHDGAAYHDPIMALLRNTLFAFSCVNDTWLSRPGREVNPSEEKRWIY